MADDLSKGVDSTASVNGYPIHSVLVPFPVTFPLGTLATDLLVGDRLDRRPTPLPLQTRGDQRCGGACRASYRLPLRWRSAGQAPARAEKPMCGKLRAAEIVAGFSIAFVLSGCGLGGPAHGAAASNAAATVDMGFESYSPATITIRAGDTVEWRNTSPITHTVTDDPKLAKKPNDTLLPTDAAAFTSGDISAGQVYLHTFDVPGTYRYVCTHHERDGMVGSVVVRSASQ